MYCKYCGTKNEYNNRFCPNCGAKMIEENKEKINAAPVYTAPQYSQTGYSQETVIEGKGFAIASLVCGIVSIVVYFIGVLGIVFGCVAKSKGYKGSMPTAGIICGIFGLIGDGIFLMLEAIDALTFL